ncbi:MAG TPA: hypothetical protein VIX82_00630, partial [Solirubrobacteraceae bacterium]
LALLGETTAHGQIQQRDRAFALFVGPFPGETSIWGRVGALAVAVVDRLVRRVLRSARRGGVLLQRR